MKSALPIQRTRSRGGMVIMEVIIALLIFGMAAVSLMQAITSTAQLAVTSQQELRMLLRLQSVLTSASKDPDIARTFEQSPTQRDDPDEYGVWTDTLIEKMENLTTEPEKQRVDDMYKITVTAHYDSYGQRGEIVAETHRYARLYSTKGGATNIPQNPPSTR